MGQLYAKVDNTTKETVVVAFQLSSGRKGRLVIKANTYRKVPINSGETTFSVYDLQGTDPTSFQPAEDFPYEQYTINTWYRDKTIRIAKDEVGLHIFDARCTLH